MSRTAACYVKDVQNMLFNHFRYNFTYIYIYYFFPTKGGQPYHNAAMPLLAD